MSGPMWCYAWDYFLLMVLPQYVQDIYGANYFITDVPAESLTHLVYAFANVNTTTGSV